MPHFHFHFFRKCNYFHCYFHYVRLLFPIFLEFIPIITDSLYLICQKQAFPDNTIFVCLPPIPIGDLKNCSHGLLRLSLKLKTDFARKPSPPCNARGMVVFCWKIRASGKYAMSLYRSASTSQ